MDRNARRRDRIVSGFLRHAQKCLHQILPIAVAVTIGCDQSPNFIHDQRSNVRVFFRRRNVVFGLNCVAHLLKSTVLQGRKKVERGRLVPPKGILKWPVTGGADEFHALRMFPGPYGRDGRPSIARTRAFDRTLGNRFRLQKRLAKLTLLNSEQRNDSRNVVAKFKMRTFRTGFGSLVIVRYLLFKLISEFGLFAVGVMTGLVE